VGTILRLLLNKPGEILFGGRHFEIL
jgi:hypothetical protein